MSWAARLTLFALFAAPTLTAQPASFVYRLGTDTLAVEQYTRTASGVTGETVYRMPTSVMRFRYALAVNKSGRPENATLKVTDANGSPIPGIARETRFTVTPDSVVRELVFADSTVRRAYAARQAMITFLPLVHGPSEVTAALRRAGVSTDSLPALGPNGNLGFTGFSTMAGDSLRLRGAAAAMVMRFDSNDRLQVVDGSLAANKVVAKRSTKTLDLDALARTFKPTGGLSGRDVARGAFARGGLVLVDYGRPSVRGRTVWGGSLVPYDSIWRAGANEATHLFTSRTITLGSLTLPAGSYTLYVQHTRTGAVLIVNRQTGQWGTEYSAAKDVGRVPVQFTAAAGHTEELTFTVRTIDATHGAIELSWGESKLSAPFAMSVATP
ncbi:DUF2911 domain-containing protein [Gemmatimonas phototrophica]|uniref:DUF2911 domain-containing protein n=1 Tax=Gemmatimonas phototrophica TaxID=1379270 RepID=UPI0006A6C53B|nr:DUF2911 domain-containing protein [Gemmatimonas phototrophica]